MNRGAIILLLIIIILLLIPVVPVKRTTFFGAETRYYSVVELVVEHFERAGKSDSENAREDLQRFFQKKGG